MLYCNDGDNSWSDPDKNAMTVNMILKNNAFNISGYDNFLKSKKHDLTWELIATMIIAVVNHFNFVNHDFVTVKKIWSKRSSWWWS